MYSYQATTSMTMNPLPPQAYTKDTLMRAYAWLQTQSEPIREMATSTDMLVSLYLKAQREGEESLARPAILNFRNELKNLAGLMGPSDHASSLGQQAMSPAVETIKEPTVLVSTPTPPLIALAPVITSTPTAGTVFGPTLVKTASVENSMATAMVSSDSVLASTPTSASITAQVSTPAAVSAPASVAAPAAATSPAAAAVTKETATTEEVKKNSVFQDLDEKSLHIIQEVTQGLNLSCETEALRLLISLGFSKAKTLIENTK